MSDKPERPKAVPNLPNPVVKDDEKEPRPAWVDKGFSVMAFLIIFAIGAGLASIIFAGLLRFAFGLWNL